MTQKVTLAQKRVPIILRCWFVLCFVKDVRQAYQYVAITIIIPVSLNYEGLPCIESQANSEEYSRWQLTFCPSLQSISSTCECFSTVISQSNTYFCFPDVYSTFNDTYYIYIVRFSITIISECCCTWYVVSKQPALYQCTVCSTTSTTIVAVQSTCRCDNISTCIRSHSCTCSHPSSN